MGWWNKLVRDKMKEKVVLTEPFTDATPTSTLVINGQDHQSNDKEIKLEDKLKKLTKTELIDFAQEKHGIDLDRRLVKQKMIDRILEEQ